MVSFFNADSRDHSAIVLCKAGLETLNHIAVRPLEYTSDVLQIDNHYEFHGPEHWRWPPSRFDHWGVTPPHTSRWRRIQTMFGFARDAYRLDDRAASRPAETPRDLLRACLRKWTCSKCRWGTGALVGDATPCS
jgi:hypothetical protein